MLYTQPPHRAKLDYLRDDTTLAAMPPPRFPFDDISMLPRPAAVDAPRRSTPGRERRHYYDAGLGRPRRDITAMMPSDKNGGRHIAVDALMNISIFYALRCLYRCNA